MGEDEEKEGKGKKKNPNPTTPGSPRIKTIISEMNSAAFSRMTAGDNLARPPAGSAGINPAPGNSPP